jgi:uncharacterized membrane protein
MHRAVVLRSVEQTMFSGPVPPPDFLAAYEQVQPGLASRLVSLAEKNSEHIRSRQASAQKFEFIQVFAGQLFAFLLCLAAFVCGTILLFNGKELGGFAAIISALAVLVTSLIYKKQSQREKERAQNPQTPVDNRSKRKNGRK